MRVVSIPSLVAIVALVVAPNSATAQQPDVATLLARIEQLEQTVRVLELRIAALEAVAEAPAPPVGQATDPGRWRELANWRQLRRGMKMDEVRELPGEPARVEANNLRIIWYWGDWRDGLSNVYFNADSRRVDGWEEPSR